MCIICELARKEMFGKKLQIIIKLPVDYFLFIADSGTAEIKAKEWADMLHEKGFKKFRLIIKGKKRKDIGIRTKALLQHEEIKIQEIVDRINETYAFVNSEAAGNE